MVGVPRDCIVLDVVVAPHKMRIIVEDFESVAAGSNDRADILLVAWGTSLPSPYDIATVHHTTNVVPNTATHMSSQAYPESRMVVRQPA